MGYDTTPFPAAPGFYKRFCGGLDVYAQVPAVKLTLWQWGHIAVAIRTLIEIGDAHAGHGDVRGALIRGDVIYEAVCSAQSVRELFPTAPEQAATIEAEHAEMRAALVDVARKARVFEVNDDPECNGVELQIAAYRRAHSHMIDIARRLLAEQEDAQP